MENIFLFWLNLGFFKEIVGMFDTLLWLNRQSFTFDNFLGVGWEVKIGDFQLLGSFGFHLMFALHYLKV